MCIKRRWKCRRLMKIVRIMIMAMFWQLIEQIQMMSLYLLKQINMKLD